MATKKKAAKKAAVKQSKYVIVRTYSAGVFAGELVSRKGEEAVLNRSRRLWFWSGAASLSELAVSGVKNASACKFAVPVDGHEVRGVIEVIPVTKEAQANIAAVPEWKA